MTIFIYARVSKANEVSEIATIDNQISQCSAFARNRYPSIKQEVFSEVCSARVFEKQKELNKLIKKISSNDILIFYNVSRFTRDSSEGITLLNSLNQKKVRIHSVFDNAIYPADRATFRRLLVEANEESDKISDRVRGALAYIRERKGHIGKTKYGYTTKRREPEEGHTYRPRDVVEDNEEMKVIQRIIYYVENRTELDEIVEKEEIGICNVISDKFNSEQVLCRGSEWTPVRVRNIYKKFRGTCSEYEGEACEICKLTFSNKVNPMILCDGCDKGFHMKCINIDKVPIEKFYCSYICQFKHL